MRLLACDAQRYDFILRYKSKPYALPSHIEAERTPIRSNKTPTTSAKPPYPLYAPRDTADSVAVREYAVGCAQGDAP